MNAENKSKCCKVKPQIVNSQSEEPRYHCPKCDNECELQKNTGLTLSEIAADDDILQFMESNNQLYERQSPSQCRKWSGKQLAATDWVVTKRKSDEAVKPNHAIIVMCGSEFISYSEYKKLQQENAAMKENCEYWSSSYREIKANLNKIRELL